MNCHKTIHCKRSGFSLIELLLVVTILGIIAAIVVPRVSASADKSEEKVREHQMSTMGAAVERYYLNEGSWPTDLTDLVPDYLPDGVPAAPGGGTYAIDGTSRRITHTP